MTTRILGLDPGSRVTGYGVIDTGANSHAHVASGCIRVPAGDMPARLVHIHEAVRELVDAHGPDEVAVEQVFVHRNAESALKLGHARGAAILGAILGGALGERPVAEYNPQTIKQALAGKGGAGKQQVAYMVRLLLNLPQVPESDAADALAVALCHAHTRASLARRRARGAEVGR